MRATEFINESVIKVSPEMKIAIDQEIKKQITSARKGLLPLGFFEIYDIMNDVAASNGVDQLDISKKLHNHTAAAPYTEIERKMLQAAYTAVGQPWDDSILDLTTDPEHPKTDGAQSPVIGFKGYTR